MATKKPRKSARPAKPTAHGRPPLPAGERRDVVFKIRVTPAQRAALVEAATADGLDVTAWIRMVAVREAGRREVVKNPS